MKEISFAATKKESEIISRIVSRAVQTASIDRVDAEMDLTACHANGCKLRLVEFLKAKDFDFFHDFNGIRNHIDRKTGKISNLFLPRFAAPRS